MTQLPSACGVQHTRVSGDWQRLVPRCGGAQAAATFLPVKPGLQHNGVSPAEQTALPGGGG